MSWYCENCETFFDGDSGLNDAISHQRTTRHAVRHLTNDPRQSDFDFLCDWAYEALVYADTEALERLQRIRAAGVEGLR